MNDIDSQKRLKGKIEFKGKDIEFLFPKNFDDFKKEICEALNLKEEQAFDKKLAKIIYYYDKNKTDENEIEDEVDYNNFIINIKNQIISAKLFIEIKEDSNINSENIKQSDSNMKLNNNNINQYIINNMNNILYNNNNIGSTNNNINDELMNKNYNNNNNNMNYNNFNNNKNNYINENHNSNNNFNNINHSNENHNNNNFNSNNHANESHNNNKIFNNHFHNNNINKSEEEQNLFENEDIQLQIEILNQIEKENQNRNNQNNQNQNQNRNNLRNDEQTNTEIYQTSCSLCRKNPLEHTIYFCPECCKIYCENCEKKEGPTHPHYNYKIQNRTQFNNFKNDTKVNQFSKFIIENGRGIFRDCIGLISNRFQNGNIINQQLFQILGSDENN